MEPQEIDVALDELENRLDRLRSLYEQYFLGIEKIEPGIARKDVDRRFWILRRTKIRNTARRFRLQVLIQRYNTFQQYWTRICREIENGTYSRHLLKAKRVGEEPLTIAARKRFGRRKQKTEPTAGEGEAPVASEGGNEAGEAKLAAAAALGSAARRSTRPPSQFPPASDGRPPERSLKPPPPTLPPIAPARPAVRAQPLEALAPLDLDFDDAPTPPRGVPATAPAAPPTAARPPAWPAVVPAAKPAVAARPVAPPASPARPATAPAAPKPAVAVGISDDRLRQVHADLVAARRKLNQGEGVSLDALSKSLRDTEAKLRAQHAGRSVDFQIVVKDGKPVVKPVVRK